MIRYSYNGQLTPPAPFVHVTIRCPPLARERDDLPAQLDTGADRTVIPGRLVDELGLVPLDELPVGSFGGQVLLLRTYAVEMGIRSLPLRPLEVIAHPEEQFVLLGRDLLNHYRIVFDGPKLALEIE